MKTTRILILLALAAILAGAVGAAQGSVLPGAPVGIDPFMFFFDENGNGAYQQWLGDHYGPLISSPGVGGLGVGGYLTYTLPEDVSTGDVAIWEPGTNHTVLSDGLRFSGREMQYFSDLGDNDRADTGFPSNFDTSYGIEELGPEGANGFIWVAGDGTPAGTNFYYGTSDIPEAASIVIWTLLGGLGIAVGRWQRRRKAM
jgi:hypothetical protein